MSKITTKCLLVMLLCMCLQLVNGQASRGVIVYDLHVVINMDALLRSNDIDDEETTSVKSQITKLVGVDEKRLADGIHETWIYAFDEDRIRRISGNRLSRSESFDLIKTGERIKIISRFLRVTLTT